MSSSSCSGLLMTKVNAIMALSSGANRLDQARGFFENSACGIDTVSPVAHSVGAINIRADKVAFDAGAACVCRAVCQEANAVLPVTGDDVSGRRCAATDDVVGGAVEPDAIQSVAQSGGARRVGADVVAPNYVVVAKVVGMNAVSVVA